MLTIPLTRVNEYMAQPAVPGQRAGQRFYDFMQLDKCTDPEVKEWADKLYNAPSSEAYAMIAAVTDPTN